MALDKEQIIGRHRIMRERWGGWKASDIESLLALCENAHRAKLDIFLTNTDGVDIRFGWFVPGRKIAKGVYMLIHCRNEAPAPEKERFLTWGEAQRYLEEQQVASWRSGLVRGRVALPMPRFLPADYWRGTRIPQWAVRNRENAERICPGLLGE